MAGKGNFIAYQALKPAELKVGDYYKSYVDDFIKRGDAENAARAKLLAEQKKSIEDRFNSFKYDTYSTTANLTDFAVKSFTDTANYVGEQRLKASQDPINGQQYLNNADRAINDYKSLASAFGSKDFIERANAKQQALANHDVFTQSDSNEQLSMIASQIPIYKRQEDGSMAFYLPPTGGVKDDSTPLEKKSVGSLVDLYTSPDEINLLRSNKSNGNNGFLDKQVYDVAKLMADEYSKNTDGNRTNGKKWFSEERGDKWFNSTFGEYSPNNVPPVVRQYAKQVLRKSVDGKDGEEVFQQAKQGIIDNIASLVGNETVVKTDKSALEIAIQQQNLRNSQIEEQLKLKSLREKPASKGSSSGGGFSSVSDGMVNKQDKVIVQILGNNGKPKGVQLWSANTVPLPKVKGFPATENTFGLANFTNAKGEKVKTIIMGAPSDNGKIVYGKISASDFSSYISKSGYDPLDVLNKLDRENSTSNRYTGMVDSSKDIYNKVKIGYKSKEVKDDDNSGL